MSAPNPSPQTVYRATALLGAGTFGSVLLCTAAVDGEEREFAVKRSALLFDRRQEPAADGLSDLDRNGGGREAATCKALRDQSGGKFIVQLVDDFITFEDLPVTRRRKSGSHNPARAAQGAHIARNMVFAMHGVSLEAVLRARSKGRLSFPAGASWTDMASHLVVGTLEALAFLHERHIAHRDLKPANILVDPRTLEVRICDLGSAKPIPDRDETTSSNWMTSRFYRAPEIMLGSHHYGVEADMWSLGVIMTELFSTGRHPRPLFLNGSDRAQLLQMLLACGTPSERDVAEMRVPARWHAGPRRCDRAPRPDPTPRPAPQGSLACATR